MQKFLYQIPLALLLITLPLLEAPKNLAVILLVIAFLSFQGVKKFQLDALDYSFILFTLSAYLSVFFGGLSDNSQFKIINHVTVTTIVFLTVRYAKYKISIDLLGVLALVGLTIACVHGLYKQAFLSARFLQLNSVGHVNHSALYIGIILSGLISFYPYVKNRIAFSLMAAFLVFCLYTTAARGAIIPFIFFLSFFFYQAFGNMNWKKKIFYMAIGLLALLGASLLNPIAVEKIQIGVQTGQLSSYRLALIKTSILTAADYPIFGVGMSKFYLIQDSLASAWKDNPLFPTNDLFFSSHAHNLYFNQLAEQGIFGVLALLFLMTQIVKNIIIQKPEKQAIVKHSLWMASVAGFIFIFIGGVFNTTFHHENALIFCIIFGLFLNKQFEDGVTDKI